jgi:hypothetical protein
LFEGWDWKEKSILQKDLEKKSEDQIGEKQHITNCDWSMKFKTNQNFTKKPRKKIKNQKNKDKSKKINK